MLNEEVWCKWLPNAENLAKKYTVASVDDVIGEFNIYLYDEIHNKRICVNFYESVDIFRRTNIFFRSAELNKLAAEHGKEFYEQWTFFKISNSSYVGELVKESYGMLNAMHCIHFVIVGSNCIVDVITDHEPKIEVVEQK